ncbi:MAG: hypothetical protein AAF206_25455, partial [Bacteroidota bacterium]
EQYAQGGATTLNFEQMDLREGVYDIVQEDVLLEKLAFNISDLESKLTFPDPQILRSRLDQAGLQNIRLLDAQPDQITQTIQVEKEGFPLWKIFAWLGIIFLAVEIALLAFGNNSRTKS